MAGLSGFFSPGPGRTRRLVWAWVTAILLAGVVASLVIGFGSVASKKSAAVQRATYVTDNVMAKSLTPDMLSKPPTGPAYAKIDKAVTSKVLTDGRTQGVVVWVEDGTVVFSEQHGGALRRARRPARWPRRRRCTAPPCRASTRACAAHPAR